MRVSSVLKKTLEYRVHASCRDSPLPVSIRTQISLEGPHLFVGSSSPPDSVEPGRQRITHLQTGAAQSSFDVCF